MQGSKTLTTMKESLEDLSSEIALPFMVGAGTISMSVLVGYRHTTVTSLIMFVIIMLVNYAVIVSLKSVMDYLDKKMQKLILYKYSNVLVRINGFILGAIGVDMVIKGVQSFFKVS